MLNVGDTIRFKENCGLRVDSETRFRYNGPSYRRGGFNVHHHFLALDGDKEGREVKVGMPRNEDILQYVVKVPKRKTDDSAAQELRQSKLERESKAFDGLYQVEPGDLVTVTIQEKGGARTYDFKVFGVDLVKMRLKGYQPTTNPGSRQGWVGVAHKDVSWVIKEKKFFDPQTDGQVALHQQRAAATAAKSRATRARRKDLREMFGG